VAGFGKWFEKKIKVAAQACFFVKQALAKSSFPAHL